MEANPSQIVDGAKPTGYVRSTIKFPYTSLKDAEQIAKELHDKWGGSATHDQLAGGLGSSQRSGAFRVKVATASTFGVATVAQRKVSLTQLGRRLIDPQTRATARVEAFLAVPLFKALFDAYKTTVLPPDAGLEQRIAELGVSAKQTARARQAFQRSAELAGFFKHGSGRLVEPPVVSNSAASSSSRNASEDGASVDTPAGSIAVMPAPLPELWLTLLRDGRSWSADKTQEFVEAARSLHDLLAKND
jgi:hypothetical protein